MTYKAVQTISADDIGSIIRFYAREPHREIVTIQTGELRQISANSGEVTLIYGNGAEREHTFQHGETVAFHPAADYSDVPILREAFRAYYDLDEVELL